MTLRILSVLALALLVAGPASANPLPEAIVFTHVQPYDGAPPAVSDCVDIVQHTTATGELEFDVYLRPLFAQPPYGLIRLQLELEWPEDWTWLGYTVPFDGEGEVSVGSGLAWLDLYWPTPPQSDDEVLLMFRCLLDVTGHGELDARTGHADVTAGCWGNYPMDVWMYGATAGVTCAWLDTDCWLDFQCTPYAQTDVLDLQVVEGGEVVTAVNYYVGYDGSGFPCSVIYSASEDWLGVEVEVLSETDHRITLTADSDGLAPGTYSAWLRGEASSVACTQVNLEVLTTVATESVSFSAVKSLY